MASIKILHASDLHISLYKQLRSPVDRLQDLVDPWDMSLSGMREKLPVMESFITLWWKKMAASSYNPEVLAALAEFIYENARAKLDETGNKIMEEGEGKLDAVVLTGDLATTGSLDDIDRVAKFLAAASSPKCRHRSDESDYRGATLSAVNVPIVFLPGNHDRFIATRNLHKNKYPIFFYPGGTHFDRELRDYRTYPVQELEISTAISKDRRLRVVILAVDFTLENFADHEGFYGWLAQGKAYSDERRQLTSRTRQLNKQRREDEVLCVLWAMHYPPGFPYPKYGRLLGERQVIREATEVGVSAILAGHTHQQMTYRNPSAAFWIFCCGTTAQHQPLLTQATDNPDVEPGNFFQVISIEDNEAGGVKISGKDYKYTASKVGRGPRPMRWEEIPPSLKM